MSLLIFKKLRRKVNFKLLQLNFLVKCKTNNIVPKFLQINYNAFPATVKPVLLKTESKMLCAVIRKMRQEIAIAEFEAYYMLDELNTSMPSQLMDLFLTQLHAIINYDTENSEKRLDKKFENLKFAQSRNKNVVSENEVPYINLSKYIPTTDEDNILKKGPAFAFPNKVNISGLIPQVESAIATLPTEQQSNARAKFAYGIQKVVNKHHILGTEKKIDKQNKILRTLKSNPNITILEADKSKQLVIIDRDEFFKKTTEVLDEVQAEELKNDPTNTLVQYVQRLFTSKKYPIPFKVETPMYTAPPKMFFKIKLHKEGYPIRPIVSKCTGPTYNLEKALNNLLAPIMEGYEYNIKSGTELKRQLENMTIPLNARLHTWDVVALYPSVPCTLAKKLILEKCEKHPNIKKYIKFITAALNLIIDKNYFQINGKFYRQHRGTPMGSAISGTCAELILRYLEEEILEKEILKPVYYRRYIDDVFIVWAHGEDKLKEMYERFNNFLPEIKFTTNKEKGKKIVFLDLNITRTSKGSLHFDVFHKPSAFPIPIPYQSAHPDNVKRSFFNAHLKRNFDYTTFCFQEDKEYNNIIELARKAGYSRNFIENINKRFRKKLHTSLTPIKEEKVYKYTTAIDYHPELIGTIKAISKSCNVKIPFKAPGNIKSQTVNCKDKGTPAGGIYKIPIKLEEKEFVYIGSTRRPVNTRITEHINSLKEDGQNTALREFILSNKDVIPMWKKSSIIDAPATSTQLAWREAVEIYTNENTVNKNPGRILAKIWQPLLEQVKIKNKNDNRSLRN